jgi:hypothetical protein
MSRPRTAETSWSRAAGGRAPAWEKTRIPSRKTIRVGIELTCAAAERDCCSSVLTDPKAMSGLASEAAS